MKIEKNSTHAVDTNILIYAFDARDKKKKETASKLLRDAFLGEHSLIVTNQILFPLFFCSPFPSVFFFGL